MKTKYAHEFEVGWKPTGASIHIYNNVVHIGTSHYLKASTHTCDRGIDESKDDN